MRNVDDEDVKLELAFYGDCRWRKIIVPRGDAMDKSKLVKYANQGLPVTSETSKEAVKYMEALETSNKTGSFRGTAVSSAWVGSRTGNSSLTTWKAVPPMMVSARKAIGLSLLLCRTVTKTNGWRWHNAAARCRRTGHAGDILRICAAAAPSTAAVHLPPLGKLSQW